MRLFLYAHAASLSVLTASGLVLRWFKTGSLVISPMGGASAMATSLGGAGREKKAVQRQRSKHGGPDGEEDEAVVVQRPPDNLVSRSAGDWLKQNP